MLKQYVLSEKDKEDYYSRMNLEGQWKLSIMRDDPVRFAKFMLGITLRDYQCVLFNKIEDSKRLAIVKARQIGFSTAIAAYCLWYAWFNKHPSGVNNNTKICVISKDDDAAKKLLQSIKDMMYKGDAYMAQFLQGKSEYTTSLFSSQKVIDNMDQLTLRNGSIIYSFPPTGKVRGTSNDILFIDEFAFLNSTDKGKFLYTDALPTLSQTDGKLIISSTPNGYGDLFYELIDPDDKLPKHLFERYMFPYSVNDDPSYVDQVKMLKDHVSEIEFKQEYECDFTQNSVTFFNAKKVKDMFDETVNQMPLDGNEYVCGMDYGMTESRSVVTLSTKIGDHIYRAYFKEFEEGWDINNTIPFIEALRDRFNIVKVVVDDCVQGDAINRQMLDRGWNVELFDFHTMKEENYCALRNQINKGHVKMAHDKQTEKQFLELEQEETKTGKLSIHKPRSGRDDIVASMVLSARPFLESSKQVKVYLV
jgi:hypothetical protein